MRTFAYSWRRYIGSLVRLLFVFTIMTVIAKATVDSGDKWGICIILMLIYGGGELVYIVAINRQPSKIIIENGYLIAKWYYESKKFNLAALSVCFVKNQIVGVEYYYKVVDDMGECFKVFANISNCSELIDIIESGKRNRDLEE